MFVLKPLRHRPIALLWGGQVLSAMGDEVYKVAVVWLAVGLIGADAGYLSAVQAASVLVFSLFGGIWADQWDHRRTMIWVDAFRAIAVLAPPIVAFFVPVTLWVLVPVAIIVSSLSAFFDPALQATLPDLTDEPELLQATSGLLNMTKRVARVAGPGLVGVLNGFIPIIHFFTLDALSFIFSAFSIFAMKDGLKSASAPVPEHQPKNIRAIFTSIGVSVKLAKKNRAIILTLLGSGVAWASWGLAFTLALPLYLHTLMPNKVSAYALLVAAYGCGNIASNLIVGSRLIRHPQRTFFIGLMIVGGGFVAMGFAPTLPLMMCAAVVTSTGGPLEDLSFVSLVQRLYRGRDVARIFRLMLTVCYSCTLICYLFSPMLLKAVPANTVVSLCGAVLFLTGLLGAIQREFT